MRQDQRQGASMSMLQFHEGVRLDPDRLFSLYAEMGEAAAETIICRATEDLAVRMADLQRLAQAGELRALVQSAQLMAKVAQQVGMTTLARVATDVCDCARVGESAAFAATLARLVRIGERSLTAVWDLQDITV